MQVMMGQMTPVRMTPVQMTPVQMTPVQMTPVQMTPVQMTPVQMMLCKATIRARYKAKRYKEVSSSSAVATDRSPLSAGKLPRLSEPCVRRHLAEQNREG
jgi:hypothetical protein